MSFRFYTEGVWRIDARTHRWRTGEDGHTVIQRVSRGPASECFQSTANMTLVAGTRGSWGLGSRRFAADVDADAGAGGRAASTPRRGQQQHVWRGPLRDGEDHHQSTGPLPVPQSVCQRDAFVPVITLDRCRRVHHREVSKNLPKAHSRKPYLIRHNNGPVALVVYFFYEQLVM